VRTTTTTIPPLPTATVSVADTPQWCTVTVRLSTGVQRSFGLGNYLANIGDEYVFTAVFHGYHVEVTTSVVDRDDEAVCEAVVGDVARD
jgi:hypothetical protein